MIKKLQIATCWIALIFLISCAPTFNIGQVRDKALVEFLDQRITIQGTAVNSKMGAAVLSENHMIWIDGLEAWPDEMYRGGDGGDEVKVKGTLIEKADLPVYYHDENQPALSGIAISPDQDIEVEAKRYLLADVRWKKIRK